MINMKEGDEKNEEENYKCEEQGRYGACTGRDISSFSSCFGAYIQNRDHRFCKQNIRGVE